VDTGLRDVSNASEHIGQPSLRIDVVEFRRRDQRRHDGGAFGTTFGTGEEPRLSAEGKSAQGAFGGVVGQANPPIVEEAGEPIPTGSI